MRDVVRSTSLAAAVAALLGGTAPAHAQAKLEARYSVTLAGLPIGRGSWVVDIGDDTFTAAASGTTIGLLRVFSPGQGTGAARGLVVAGQPIAGTFAASIKTGKKIEEIRMSLVGGNVKDVVISPPPSPDPDRIPITDAHRHGVSDPMSSSLHFVPGRGALIGPEACPRVVAVFDGRLRYDLRLAFKRIEHVKAERGYEGPAVVCSIGFAPIAGHEPNRTAIKYLIEQRNIEAWLVPLAGTRVVVPFRVSIPTPIGVGVMEATQFVTGLPTPRTRNSRTQ